MAALTSAYWPRAFLYVYLSLTRLLRTRNRRAWTSWSCCTGTAANRRIASFGRVAGKQVRVVGLGPLPYTIHAKHDQAASSAVAMSLQLCAGQVENGPPPSSFFQASQFSVLARLQNSGPSEGWTRAATRQEMMPYSRIHTRVSPSSQLPTGGSICRR
ncbi:hypothetical protein IWZ01DRAFT_160809 [Phyllosticta capitalensis]